MNHTLPKFHCPSWCEGHDEESIERTDIEQQVEHFAGIGGDAFPTLTNAWSGTVTRDQQVQYDVAVSMAELPTGVRLGEFVTFDVSVNSGKGPDEYRNIALQMTPGEARTLAAILLAAAERLDIAPVVHNLHRYRSTP